MKRFLAVLLIWIAAVPLADISFGQGREKIALKDMAGRRVRVSRNPQRIVCIAPGTLRLIIYLGAKDKVAGVEDIEKRFPTERPYRLAHPELGKLPSIGPGGVNAINKMPDSEAILAVNPDVIFISYMEKRKADLLQDRIGIPVVVLSYGNFGAFDEAVYDSLRLVGRVLAAEERAEAVISFIENAKRDLAVRVKGYPENERPAVYAGCIGFKGAHGIESTETNYPPFTWIAAKNVVGENGRRGHLFAGKENLLAWDPDIIFIDGGGNELLRQDYRKNRTFYHGLKAFRSRKVYLLYPFNWYMTNIGTVLCDAYTAGKILYPERFSDVDIKTRADKIYRFLLGRPVYTEMMKIHGPLGGVLPYIEHD